MDALHPHVVVRERPGADHRARRGHVHLRRPRQAVPRRPVRAVRGATPGTAGTSWPRPPTSRRRSWRSSRSGATPTPRPSSWPSGWPNYAPGDLNKVFFTTGGGEAVETAWKLAKQYYKLTGKPHEVQGDLTGRRLPRHPAGRAVHHRAARAEGAVRAAGARRAQGAQHQHLPRARSTATTRRRSAAGPPTRSSRRSSSRAPTRSPRSSWSRCRTPAAASRRRPGTSSGSARSATRYDVLLVSDEVICAFGRLGTMFACDKFGYVPDMITCAKGMTSRLLPDRRVHRLRPARRAVLHGRQHLPARLHLRRPPGLGRGRPGQPRHLRARGPQPARARQRGARSSTPSRSCTTCRSSATSAATASSTASSWSRTRPPRRRSTTRRPSACCTGSCPRRSSTTACTAAPTTAATRSSSSRPPLISDQALFDEIEDILRDVLGQAWSKL